MTPTLFTRMSQSVMIFFLSLSAVVALAGRASCTSIVAIRTSDEVYIGTDSLVKVEYGGTLKQCKIANYNDMYVAFSGIPVMVRSEFDAYALAQQAFAGEGTPLERVKAYDRLLLKKFEAAVESLRLADAKAFGKWYADDVVNRVAMQVMIAAVDKGIPVLFMLEYRIVSPKGAPVQLQSFLEESTTRPSPGRAQIFFIGLHEAIDALLARRDYFSDFDPIRSINDWIKEEIAAEPQTVSLPIDILRIGAKKVEWIQHKPECADIPVSTVKKKAKSNK